MSEQENIKIAQAFFDNFNAHDLGAIEQLQADDFKAGYAAGAAGPMSKEQNRMYLQNFLTAFPDIHFEVTLSVAQGDYVVLHWIGTGTHTGPLGTLSGGAIEPTGNKATVPGSTTTEIKNGKHARSWTFWDMAGLLGQLGLLPPM